MAESSSVIVERAMIIAAIHTEPDFLAYMMDMPCVCSSTLSEYVAHVLPDLANQLMNGMLQLEEFVAEATYQYIKL